MSAQEFHIGHESAFEKFPAQINVNRDPFFLVKNESNYKLFSAICPHAGGMVMDYGTSFVCPLHYWSFDKQTGNCTMIPSACLETFEVTVKDGELYVELT